MSVLAARNIDLQDKKYLPTDIPQGKVPTLHSSLTLDRWQGKRYIPPRSQGPRRRHVGAVCGSTVGGTVTLHMQERPIDWVGATVKKERGRMYPIAPGE